MGGRLSSRGSNRSVELLVCRGLGASAGPIHFSNDSQPTVSFPTRELSQEHNRELGSSWPIAAPLFFAFLPRRRCLSVLHTLIFRDIKRKAVVACNGFIDKPL